MNIIYLHIPHTSGRTIKRTLWLNNILKDIICVHNETDIKTIMEIAISFYQYTLKL